MKKVLSLVLVIAMVLSSMSMAFAATPATSALTDIADSDYQEAIETLVALGIVNGYEDGTFKPGKTVTRAEMAKLMVITLGYENLVSGSTSNFSDTKGHWADAYIALAAGKGMVKGYPDGTFGPDKTVSYDEAITMVVRALGYTDACNEIKNMAWPTNYKVKAAELDITDDVAMSTTGADRGGVAQIIYNALEATLVTINSDGDVVKTTADNDDDEEYFVVLLSRIATLDNDYEVTPDVVDVDSEDYAGNIVDLAPYMFQNLDVYMNDDDEVVYVSDVNSLVYDGSADDLDGYVFSIELANGDTKDVNFDVDDSILVDDAIDADYVFENGSVKESDVDLDYLNDDTDTVTIVANDKKSLGGDGDGKVDADEIAGIVTTVRTDVVRVNKTYVADNDSISGIDLPTDSDGDVDLTYVKVTGDATTLEEVEEDDIIVAYASEDGDKITLVVTRNAVEGKVTRVYDSNTFYVDGTSYDTCTGYIGDTLELGDEGTFYLDQDGKIADYDGEAAGPTDYAVIVGSENGDVDSSYGDVSVDDYPGLKLATQEDEVVTYEVAIELNDDGEVEDSLLVDETALFDGTYADGDILDIETEFLPTHAYLVKYSLDSDGRIDEIEVVADVTAYETAANDLNDIDLDSTTDTLADGAIVFDAGDSYSVVDADSLDAEIEAYEVLNDDGDIEVLVVKDGEVENSSDVVYAYVTKITKTYDADGNKVNQFVVYTDGAKQEILANDDDFAVAGEYSVFSFMYDGDVIDEDETVTFDLAGDAATATAISASKGKIELDLAGTADDGWYALSDHATIISLNDDDTVDEIQDLYDIDEDDTFTVYFNADGDIDLIVIQ